MIKQRICKGEGKGIVGSKREIAGTLDTKNKDKLAQRKGNMLTKGGLWKGMLMRDRCKY